MNLAPIGSTLPGVTHHRVALNGAELHYAAAGRAGPPILLVHGFPETWWAFHKLIPLLVRSHRVFAVDLRGFGDSSHEPGDYDSATVAEDLYRLIKHLDVGRVHVVGQDISGAAVFRLVASHPDDIVSLTAIEMGLAGFGLEMLADVTHGGAWHIGVMAAAGIPEMLLAGHEREFIAWLFNSMSANPSAIGGADIEEFARSYSRPEGWRGATGLYQSMLREGAEIKAIAETGALKMPVLAIGAGGGTFTVDTISKVAAGPIRSVLLQGVGHYAALEAPDEVASAIADFVAGGDGVSG
ncbi:alpha/beta hydrolase [Kaistia dalseonensis]|uniref:Pimeloyl-ACP methyl ester carboxylesterase n=1 Tax=Kaistia dalseonensis TaxID=410840 RepID=A0ABU0H2N5_9HYPH|nr:alpha/beta hydrolase [Kaistia dalseonensis]MCX5493987.1 alpha/beta hydrolase [Kaistia dalseonensis]MDQ0436563.1 pimeloyl-ACP methyl ester carboxylesterase [Kaistia dalseonensis]